MKTKKNNSSVTAHIESIGSDRRKEESKRLVAMMEKISNQSAKMWGHSIIGCGTFKYRYADGKIGEICNLGFSPRSRAISIYGVTHFPDSESLLKKLGKHKTGGGGCLYLNKLDDVDLDILGELMKAAYTSREKESSKIQLTNALR